MTTMINLQSEVADPTLAAERPPGGVAPVMHWSDLPGLQT